MSNWKTNLAGVAALLGAVSHLITALLGGDTSTIYTDIMAIIAGVGLIFAHDA